MINNKISGISLFALVMLITGAVDSIRNLPATALFGSSLIFFFIFSSVVFLIPAALISAELSSAKTENGGVFHWTRMAFGDNAGFLAIWLQWISNIVWFPTLLSFIAGTASYFFSPELAQNKVYLVSVILGMFWFLTLINLRGIETSAKFTSFCTVVGMVIPMGLIILFALIWMVMGYPLQIHFTAENMFPALNNPQNWISLTAIMTSFLGIELAAVHIKDVHNPQKTFPKALFISVALILVTMILGSLAIAIILPRDRINLVNGMMQAFIYFSHMYHISWLVPILAVLIIIGSSGGMISWVISPAKGLLQAAQDGYLPHFLRHQNKHGVASRILIAQAILVSVFCLAFLLMPSVNGSYWLLTALSTQLYILMYILMFFAGLVLRKKLAHLPKDFMIPGGKLGLWLTIALGLFGCMVTLIAGFIPPAGIDVGSIIHYEIIFAGGLILMISPAFIAYWYRAKNTDIQSSDSAKLPPKQKAVRKNHDNGSNCYCEYCTDAPR